MPLILLRCPSCRKSGFAFARPAEVARCARCGKPLNGRQDSSMLEREIRERLYTPRSGRGRWSASENG